MSYDELELDTLGDRKTALFVIISDTDDTFNFIVAIMYSQMFNLLCDRETTYILMLRHPLFLRSQTRFFHEQLHARILDTFRYWSLSFPDGK